MDDIGLEDLLHRLHGAAGALYALTNLNREFPEDSDDPTSVGLSETSAEIWRQTSALVERFNAGSLRERQEQTESAS